MRISLLLPAVLAALVLIAPGASARPLGTLPPPAQDLRSPDARDAAAAGHAQTLQDLAHLRAQNPRTAGLAAAEEQGRYYTTYGHPATIQPAAEADDSSPWLTIGLGIGLIVLVAGSVGFAVRTRRRSTRVRVAV